MNKYNNNAYAATGVIKTSENFKPTTAQTKHTPHCDKLYTTTDDC